MDSCSENKLIMCNNDHILPDDCLNLIYEKLDEKDDRDSFGLTCQRFLDIQHSSRKFTELKVLPLYPISKYCFFQKLLLLLKQLDSLLLTQLIDSSFTFGFKLCCLNRSFSPLRLLVISLYKYCINDNKLKILSQSCGSLKQVDLSWCCEITDLGIGFLNKNCQKLRALWIIGCYEITGVNFRGFSPDLAFFEAKFCSLKSQYISRIVSAGGIEYLNLSSPSMNHWGDELGVIGLAPNLKFLDLENCSLVEDHDILEISKGCPLLQEWNLSYCNKIQIYGWKYIGFYCQNLETLHANNCRNLCNEGLLALINGCKRLSVLNMTNCNQINSRGILTYKKKIKDVTMSRLKSLQTPNFLT